jgi:uncharacterized protein YifE (UPF0438 family)
MTPPDDHAAYLARTDFAVPAGGDLTPGECAVLAKFGRWMEALEGGVISPLTPGQEQFLRAARGELAPSTEFERAWVKFSRLRRGVAGTFQQFAEAKAHLAAVEAEYSARRMAVLATIQDQLNAVDAEFGARLQAAHDAAAAGEVAVREVVLRVAKGIHLSGIDARYYPGRVTWDAAGMERFASAHPEVLAFRKVGKPWVSLRIAGGGSTPPTVRQLPASEPEQEGDEVS